jgi:hypothetical protein
MDADSGAKGSTFRSRARASFSSSTTLAPLQVVSRINSLCFFLFWPIMYIRDGQIHNFYSVDVDDALCVLYAIMSRGNLYEIIYSVAYTDGFKFFGFEMNMNSVRRVHS